MPFDNTVWVQGQTGMNPAMQDYMRLRDAGYARNLAEIRENFQLEQVKQMAELGAQRLESFGGEGAQWAQMLRTNPYAAYEMVRDQGGFAGLEAKLQMGQAVGTSEMGRVMARQGPEAYRGYLDTQVAQQNADANTRNAASAAQNANTQEGLLGVEERLVPIKEMAARADYIAAQAKARAGQDLNRSQFTAVMGRRTPHLDSFDRASDFAKRLIVIDPRKPGAQYRLTSVIQHLNNQLSSTDLTNQERMAITRGIDGLTRFVTRAGEANMRVDELEKFINATLEDLEIQLAEAPQRYTAWAEENASNGLSERDFRLTLPDATLKDAEQTYRRSQQWRKKYAEKTGNYQDVWGTFSEQEDPFNVWNQTWGRALGGLNTGGESGPPSVSTPLPGIPGGGSPSGQEEIIRKNPKDGKMYRRVGPDQWVEVR